MPLMEYAALCAFWSIPKTLLLKVVEEVVGLDVQAGWGLFELLWALTMDILKCDDEAACQLLRQRCTLRQGALKEVLTRGRRPIA